MFEDNKISNNSIDEISLVDLSMLLLKRKKLITYIVGSIIIITAVVLILIPNEYQSQASILPTGNRDQFSDLKNLAGIGMMSTNADNSSDLFPVILKSREITSAVLAEKYSFKDDNVVIGLTLYDYFDLESPDKLYDKLLEITDVKMDKKTGVITVGVTTKYPEFSQKILEKYIAELENFNLYKRASQAKDNVKYLSNQLETKKIELENLENEFEKFQTVNRDWVITSDPEVLMQVSRFKRELEIRTTAFVFLNQEYELAKLESLKDVPIVRILDKPTLPDKKVYPSRSLFLILITIITSLLTCFGIIIYESINKILKSRENEFENELSDILKSTAKRVNRFVNIFSKKDKVDF